MQIPFKYCCWRRSKAVCAGLVIAEVVVAHVADRVQAALQGAARFSQTGSGPFPGGCPPHAGAGRVQALPQRRGGCFRFILFLLQRRGRPLVTLLQIRALPPTRHSSVNFTLRTVHFRTATNHCSGQQFILYIIFFYY